MTKDCGPLRRLTGTLAGGWHDAGSIARRIAAPLRRLVRRPPGQPPQRRR